MIFAEKILKLRRREGLSQEELANRLEVSRQAVSRWELGTAMPDAPKLFQLSRIFGVTADYLLDDAQEEFVSPEANAAQPQPMQPMHPKRYLAEKIFGGITAGLGAAGLLTIGIFSSIERVTIFPTYEAYPDGTEKMVQEGSQGLEAFLEMYQLEWLFGLCIACIPVGIAIALLPWVIRRIRKPKQ